MAFDDDPALRFSRGEREATCPKKCPGHGTRRIRGNAPFGRRLAILLLVAPASLGIAAARPTAPIAVAPGGTSDTRLASACSSFHWGPSRTALSFELVVYPVEESNSRDDESVSGSSIDIEPVLSAFVPGVASSWTPPLDQCLRTGTTYAWSVRAIQGADRSAERSDWAAPLFFRVPEGPSPAEIAQALDLLRELRRASPEATVSVSDNDSAPLTDADSLPEPPAAGHRTIHSGVIQPGGPAVFSGGGPASLRVAGEVRSVDSTGEPRLWGKGRPGTEIYGRNDGTFCSQGSIRFGLSKGVADWGSADSACPEGTWVCRQSDIQAAPACNTARPDSSTDALLCDGNTFNHEENTHIGWLADHSAAPIAAGLALTESDTVFAVEACSSLPVWCCRH